MTQLSAGTTTRTTTYGYDLDGNVTSEVVTMPGSGTSQQVYNVYDPATDRLIETYTGNSVAANATTDIHYGYDALGRLASVTEYRIDDAATATDALGSHNMYSANGSITTTNLPNTVYTYDAAGNLHSEALPDGITQTYTYNDLNRLTNEAVTEGSTTIANYAYGYTTDGQRNTETDSLYTTGGTLVYTNTINWGYDGDNRLHTESFTTTNSGEQSYVDTYTYDLGNNRLSKTAVTTIVTDLVCPFPRADSNSCPYFLAHQFHSQRIAVNKSETTRQVTIGK